MVTLQKTFKYEGDVANTPFEKVQLQFKYPVFDYTKSNPDDPAILRQIVSAGTAVITQDFNKENYQISFPTNAITGIDDAIRLFLYYTLQCIDPESASINGLSLAIDVQFGTNNNLPFGGETLNAVYFVKNINQVFNADRMLSVSHFNVAPANLAAFLEKNVFLVNKEVYDRILPEFNEITNSNHEPALLNIVQKLVEVTDSNPALLNNFDDRTYEKLLVIVREQKIRNLENAAGFVKKYFGQLFDFPVSVEKIKTFDVAGTFHVKATDDTVIIKDDLLFYDLSLEYSTINNAGQQIMHFGWPTDNLDINDNTIEFSFSETRPIVLNSISGLMTIKVKGFDGSLLWSKGYRPEDPALKEVPIEVALLRPNTLNPSGPKGTVDTGKKLRGQLVGLTKKCPLKDVTVIVQVKKEGDEAWRIVAAASTDNSGNFSMAYPFGVFTAAQAIISLMPNSPADVPINADNKENQTISDDFLYLMVTDPIREEPEKEEDCDCHAPKKAARLPDQADLINSDEYTQDIGAGCVNLSTPNRTLSEYNYQGIVRTSDPDVANYTLRKITTVPGLYVPVGPIFGTVNPIKTRFELVGGAEKIKRSAVDLNNPIQWQDAPDSHENLSIYQSVTIATGHILHYKSEFKADGYSLGNLLYSLPLAPGQKKQIVVIDSAHSLQGAELQTISQGESLAANLVNERGITDQLGGSINEAVQGQSSASTSGISAGLGIGANIGVVSGALGVAGGYANSNSSASQNSSRNTAQFFGEKLRQSIMQNAESYRQLNASVVTSVQEGQHYAATTEVVANHNHCHALTMMYFEVLRHYAIFQELENVEECVFVPLLMTNFTVENIYKWSDVLSRHLLPMHSNTYLQPFGFLRLGRQHPLLKAFDANERIKTNYANVDFPTGSYDEEPINFITGEINIKTNLQRPKTRYDRIKSLPIITKTVTHEQFDTGTAAKSAAAAVITGGLSLLFGGGSTTKTVSEQVLTRAMVFDAFMQLDANYETVPPAQCIRVINFQPNTFNIPGIGNINISGADFFENSVIDKNLWTNYAIILGYSNVYDLLDYYFKGRLIAEWDDIYNSDIAPVLFEKIADSIKIEVIAIDLTTMSKYRGGEQLIRINLRGNTTKKRKEFPLIIKLFSDSNLIKSLKDFVTLTIGNIRINYSTIHYNGVLFNGYAGDDLLDGTDLYIPENSDEKRNPRKEDIYIVTKLIEHLNSNLEHYNKSLWYDLDTDRRYMLLDGFNIQIFNDFGVPAGFRSLASVVKNQLITVTGNSLVFPVAAGYKVSQSYIAEKNENGEQEDVNLFDHYKPLTPIPPYRISVPSRGVFLEAVQGACDACEKIKENSAQDWAKFTADEPTPIATVTPPVPTITDWKAAFKDFATPLINIQNAPATPEPGTGLAGLSELLGKAGIFKDITGLDANQQNVIKTFLSNQENAKAFAEMAKSMAMQEHNTQNSDKIMDTLKTAKDSGAINQDDYGKLVKEHIQKQIDGEDNSAAQTEKDKAAKPTLTDAAVKAADQGKNVKAQKIDKERNTESVDISGNKTDTVLAKVNSQVPKLKQENEMACWATAATMMMSWKKGKTLTVPQVLTEAGNVYLQKFNNKEGLKSSEKEGFIAALNMVGEAPANYSLQQYIDWVNSYGPLWITTDSSSADGEFSPHARILTKITGAGSADGNGTDFIFNDPATGTEISETFTQFISAFEQMVTDNGADLFIQIVHFKDSLSGGEGSGPVVNTTIADKFLTDVINNPDNQFKSSGEIDDFFTKKTGVGFNAFFANQIGNKGVWLGITIASDELPAIRFMNIWDNVPDALSLTNVNLVQFLCLQSAILNETGGKMDIPSEQIGGLKDFPGLKYTYSTIPKGPVNGYNDKVFDYSGKTSYNAPSNKLAFDLFNDADFIKAHGGLTGADLYKNTADVKWKGTDYPVTETDTNKLPFVAEADFHKYRGRGYIQLTWRGNYLPVIDYILKYTGTNTIILKHKTAWTAGLTKPVANLTTSEYNALKTKAATISSNSDWDELFQNTDSIIALKVLDLHASGNALKNIKTDTAANCKASILAYGASLNGGGYNQKLLNRVMQILNKIGNV